MKSVILISYILIFEAVTSGLSETIKFKATDGLEVTGELYMSHEKTAPFILLFHQAGWSRGEYMEIAPKLNKMGFNCLAVDLRSGGAVNGIKNLTNQNAKDAGKGTSYIDAIADMLGAINYVKENYAQGKLIIWGSSYSSALALKLAGDHNDIIDAVLAFAPGEYFSNQGKSKTYITTGAKNITQPVFITSAKNEKDKWWGIYQAIPAGNKTYYLPQTTGNHGSRALWEKFPDNSGYWEAVTKFLDSLK